jgi:HlyD family secretion protein
VAEIIIENLAGVMTVPIQCVATRRGRTHCYVRRGEQVGWVPVDVGLSNEMTVEIKGGLKAGDQVALAPPAEDEGKTATAAKPH